MKDLLKVIVRHLVNDPEAVELKETRGRSVAVYELRMPRDDAARVIGKHGRTIDSIRTILSAAASRSDQHSKVVLQVVDSQRSAAGPAQGAGSRGGFKALSAAV